LFSKKAKTKQLIYIPYSIILFDHRTWNAESEQAVEEPSLSSEMEAVTVFDYFVVGRNSFSCHSHLRKNGIAATS